MKVGLVEFGNGIIMPDGVTVSPAMNVHTISSDLASVKTALDGMQQKKGFTNMAQAFALAETMYTSAGRVRNAVMESSTTCPGTEIVDCDEDNWVGKKGSVECDDSCPAVPNPTEVYECGGWQEIYSKSVVDPPDECGLRCPALQRTKKCNQKKCPVDCVMSE